jgi:hypothetical protein
MQILSCILSLRTDCAKYRAVQLFKHKIAEAHRNERLLAIEGRA